MRNIIKKILKEEQEWFDEIKPMEIYLPWMERGIEGLEKWKGEAYQEDDDIGESILQLKKFPTKKNVRHTINTIQTYIGLAYEQGDDFDWALDDLKMSIDPYSWKRFNIHLNGGKGEMSEALKDVYITDENYSCLVTNDEEWILVRSTIAKQTIPKLIKTENLDVNSLSSCYLINDGMLERHKRSFRSADKVFLKETLNASSILVSNNFTLKVVKFKDGIILDKPVDTDSYFQ